MRRLTTLSSALLLVILFSNTVISQEVDNKKTDNSLQFQIDKMDSLLFDVAFNNCDLELFKSLLSPNLEFYDDRSGLNTSYEKEIASFQDKCSKPISITRKPIQYSVHILGDFGALQKGAHEFYVDGQKVEKAKFINIWEKTDNSWIVKRAISYDHEEASK